MTARLWGLLAEFESPERLVAAAASARALGLRKIEAYPGSPYTRFAMQLMALTFVRTGELIGARWEEFDLDAAEWRIPAARMKMKTPHIVPLSSQAVDMLRCLHELKGLSGLLFQGERDHEKPMSNGTIFGALRRMGYAGRMTGHGFRGVASTILHEQGFDHAHIELQLAHMERDDVSAAYNFATYLPFDLLVKAVEKPPYYFELGGGYKTDTGIFGRTKIGDHNFMGTGKDVSLSGEMSEVGYRWDTGISEPRFLGQPIRARAGVTGRRRVRNRASKAAM
jgi:hypothetical protein